uniref:Uncharacterized protein n=1 Tax=Chelydra serpentina TaxID=8475 RepID=A0A8C3SNY5_CHESE
RGGEPRHLGSSGRGVGLGGGVGSQAVISPHPPGRSLPMLVLVPQHTVPKKAEAEIDALYDVFLDIQDVMFLGDFNADCGYVAKKRWGQIRLRREPSFHWLIGDAADTTVRNSTRCAYDRIVVHGQRCLGLVVPGSAQPFDFPGTFGFTEAEVISAAPYETDQSVHPLTSVHCPSDAWVRSLPSVAWIPVQRGGGAHGPRRPGLIPIRACLCTPPSCAIGHRPMGGRSHQGAAESGQGRG